MGGDGKRQAGGSPPRARGRLAREPAASAQGGAGAEECSAGETAEHAAHYIKALITQLYAPPARHFCSRL